MSLPEVFILGGARTPMAEYIGALKDVSALALGAIAARAALARTGLGADQVDHVVFGNVLQTSADAIYGARHIGLKAGVPVDVAALTVNRLCGSGIQAAISGAHLIQLGEAETVLTGGAESMSQAPHVIRGLRSGLRLGQGHSKIRCGRRSPTRTAAAAWPSPPRTARRSTGSPDRRRTSSRFAASSSQRRRGTQVASRRRSSRSRSRHARHRDVRPRRPHASRDHARGAREAAAGVLEGGCVTAGNASGIVDGGAALLLGSRGAVERLGVTPLAQLRDGRRLASSPR